MGMKRGRDLRLHEIYPVTNYIDLGGRNRKPRNY